MKQTYTVHYNKNMNRESSSSREIKVDEVGECPVAILLQVRHI